MTQYIRKIFVAVMLVAGASAGMQSFASERIEHIDTAGPQIRVADGALELTAPDNAATRFEIYSITGQLVKAVELQAARAERIELPQGCYIVRTPGRSQKIVVK